MKTIRLLAACAPLVAMSLACGTSGEATDPPPMVSPTGPADVPPDPEAPSNVVERAEYMFSMRDGQVSECVEIRVTFTPPDPAPAAWPPPPRTVEPDETFTRIDRPCTEQFSDRTVLGRCTSTPIDQNDEDGVHRLGRVTRHWYDALVLTDDRLMNSCVRDGGEWWGIDRNSLEAQQARTEHELRESQRALDRLNSRRGR